MEDATITLYNVRFCGFYSDADEHKFATFAETVKSILAWVKTLASVGESSTYSVDEDSDILRAFCLDLRHLGGGHYLLATWNELPTVEEGVQLLQVDSQIGAADISAVKVDALSLPGYPAFFCLDTHKRQVLNIRFDQRLNGSRQLQRFISGYLASASRWCVWDAEDETKLLGYSNDDDDNPKIVPGVVSRFATTMCRISQQEEYIRANCGDIRKIVRRATISPEIELHKTFLDSARQLVGLHVNNRLKADINFQYQFKTRLTPKALEGVIAQHDENIDSNWDDVGFIFARESQKVHWLSSAIARASWSMDVERERSGMINVDSLAAYLEHNVKRMFGSFDE